jgi:hypothetical protein
VPSRTPTSATGEAGGELGLFERFRATRDDAARDALIARFLPLARRLARRDLRRAPARVAECAEQPCTMVRHTPASRRARAA